MSCIIFKQKSTRIEKAKSTFFRKLHNFSKWKTFPLPILKSVFYNSCVFDDVTEGENGPDSSL